MHRLRQFEPSWFCRGQTTSLLASVTEKELVRAAFSGIASCIGYAMLLMRLVQHWWKESCNRADVCMSMSQSCREMICFAQPGGGTQPVGREKNIVGVREKKDETEWGKVAELVIAAAEAPRVPRSAKQLGCGRARALRLISRSTKTKVV